VNEQGGVTLRGKFTSGLKITEPASLLGCGGCGEQQQCDESYKQ